MKQGTGVKFGASNNHTPAPDPPLGNNQQPQLLPTPSAFHAGVLRLEADTSIKLSSETLTETFEPHPGFEIPPFDLELFTEMLDQMPVPERTAAELEAHQFLREMYGN